MFLESIKKIAEKISKIENFNERKKTFTLLEKKINSNELLKKQWETSKILKKNKNLLSEQKSYDLVKKSLQENEVKNTIGLKVATKELLEFFGIPSNDLKIKKFDISNERKLIEHFVNKQKLELKEGYKQILQSKNKSALEKQLKIISFYTESFQGTRKIMFEKSIESLNSKLENDFDNTTKKTYKLNNLLEGILLEKSITSKMSSIGIFNNISVQIFTDDKNAKMQLAFEMPITPVAKNSNQWAKNARLFKQKIERAETLFLNKCISQTSANELVSPEGSIWKVIQLTQINDNSQLVTTTPAKFRVYLSLNKTITEKESREVAFTMIEKFSEVLPEYLGDQIDFLTPDAQTELVSKLGEEGKIRKWHDNWGKLGFGKKGKQSEEGEMFNSDDFFNSYKGI